MSMITEAQADMKPCPMYPDECDNAEGVEPEVDGSHKYWECESCGYAFDFQKVEEGLQIEGNCAVGVPEEVRRQASRPMEKALQDDQGTAVNLGTTIPIGRPL